MVSSALTIQDILPFRANNKKVDMDAFLPFIVLPFLLLIATISRTITIIIMVVIGMGVLYVYTRPRQKNRSVLLYSNLYFKLIIKASSEKLVIYIWYFIVD